MLSRPTITLRSNCPNCAAFQSLSTPIIPKNCARRCHQTRASPQTSDELPSTSPRARNRSFAGHPRSLCATGATSRQRALARSPAADSPVPVKERVDKPKDLNWTPDQPLTLGLRARDVQIGSASVFDPGPNEIRLAAIDKGPIMVASVSPDGRNRSVVIGFDPFEGPMRYELATPLLLAT